MPDVPNRKFYPVSSTDENPVITHAVEVFARYDPKFNNHMEARSLDFWLVCLETQLQEIRAARMANDWQKVAWELTDVVTVAIDALAKIDEFRIWKLQTARVKARIISGVIEERLALNREKRMESRDMKYYLDKLKELKLQVAPDKVV